MARATAIPSAARAVRTIAGRRAGRTPPPMRFRYFTRCLGPGRRDGLIRFVHAGGSPRPTALTGRAAARYKETVVRGTVLGMRRSGVLTLL
ncbi:hypothetical protein F4561_003719 [Lipingzhangella halophila]|uniref:Uncharacterized protein n=1 Tax=Lipingzhangella halophila TaxID=1783352 RepID=A0A7W7RJ14_9ACTN|nr:hypothetical protein [Lipingzhangella halophila]MBB4932899.1 hypothetical protein [Lipingzhangella halophila]